ncbi:MAG: neutral zinc metallopeptidase [Proteobacteria bacterium]|nr:neutral zinc metallopeptidase [Pseudomonadota bacterium]
MRDDDLRASSNIDDRRGMSGGAKGGLGIGVVLVLTLLGWATGIDPRLLIGGAEMVAGGGQPAQVQQQGRQGTPTDATGQFVAKVLGETEDVWTQVLPKQAGRQYQKPVLVLYSGVTRSGCGTAQSAMGPFYCPLDQKLYLDTSFFQDMQRKLGGGGDFAYAYVIAHEVGHHIQNLIGLLPKVQKVQQQSDQRTANQVSVRTELMADCLAGVWAYHMNQRHQNIDDSDVRQAVATASAIGDDRLQQSSGGRVVPDSFTHGSAEQRVQWLTTGLRSGQVQSCDTFK